MRTADTPLTWTRSQVAEMCGLTREGLRQWEREGLCRPSIRQADEFGDTTPNLYGPTDAAQALFVASARQLGISRAALVAPAQRVGNYGLAAGWSGWVVITGRTTLIVAPDALAEQLVVLREPAALLVWLQVPDTTSASRAANAHPRRAGRPGPVDMTPQPPSHPT